MAINPNINAKIPCGLLNSLVKNVLIILYSLVDLDLRVDFLPLEDSLSVRSSGEIVDTDGAELPEKPRVDACSPDRRDVV